MIHVIAEIEVREGMLETFLKEFRRIVPIVRDEDGCIDYGPAVDRQINIEQQPPIRNNVVTVIEKWTSEAALKAHLTAPHMVDYRKRASAMIVSVSINALDPA